jgi:sphingomyelin phosphodiesterase acid-like 3
MMRRCVAAIVRCIVVFATLSVYGGSSDAGAQPAPAAAQWLLVSDIHFNPFDDINLVPALVTAPVSGWHDLLARSSGQPSTYGKDTNYALLASAIAQMRATVPNPPVVVIAGDFLAHDFLDFFQRAQPGKPTLAYQAFVDKTIAYLALEMNAAYPNAQFVITLGNNDSYCGDYASTPNSPFLAYMAAAWAPLVNRNGRAPDFVTSFPRGGYYVATLPTQTPSQAVVVNSVFWSAKYHNTCGLPNTDPGATELGWLHTVVSTPATGYRWFVTHIPPGIDAYSSLRANKAVPFMQDNATQDIVATVSGAGAHGTEFIAGHTHHASFEIVGQSSGAPLPVLIIPSISPVQANNPAFVVANVATDTGTITDMTTYALLLPLLGNAQPATWTREYSFNGAYGTSAFDATGLARLQTMLGDDPVKRASYATYYGSQSPVGAINLANWPWYWCTDVNITAQAYTSCVTQTLPH